MKFDDIIDHLGQFGLYQRRMFILLCIPSFVIGMQVLASVFTMATPKHRCALPMMPNDTYEVQSPYHAFLIQSFIPPEEDDSEGMDSCNLRAREDFNMTLFMETSYSKNLSEYSGNETIKCDRWVYDTSEYDSTLISKLNLVCENKLGRSHVQMFFMLGSLLGALLLGPPADFFGRRKVMMVNVILHIIANFSLAFTPNFASLCLFMMVNGAATSGLFIVIFVIGMEFVGTQKRVFAGYIILINFAVGVCVLVGLAYYFTNWHHLQLSISILPVFFLSYYWLIPESPRWLVNKGKYSKAEKILNRAAVVNKRIIPSKLFCWENLETEGSAQEPIHRIFTYPRLVIRSLVIFFNWMVCSMTYYGISLNVAELAGSIYLNMFLYGIVEIVAIIFCICFLNRVGRRRIHLFCMFLSGVCCTVSPFPSMWLGSDYHWLNIVLAVTGKAGVSAAFSTIWLYTSELFPTVVRNAGVSSSSLCARFGGIIAPYIANLGTALDSDLGRILPLLIFGVASLVAGGLALLLPETSNATLPDTFQDANNFGRKSNKKTYELTKDQLEREPFGEQSI